MHIQSVLQQLGYSQNQVKIYLVSLKMGEARITELTEQVNIPRSTVNEVLEEMCRLGVMNYYKKRGHKYWVAENPEKLMASLKGKEVLYNSILPQLISMRNTSSEGKPVIQTFAGIEGIKLIFDDIVESKHPILALVSEWDFWEEMGEGFMTDFIERRKQHFLPIKFIVPHTESAVKLKLSDKDDLRKTRFLPNDIQLRKFSNYIFGNKVAIITLNQKEQMGIVIEDLNVVKAMTIYFDSLWHQSTER